MSLIDKIFGSHSDRELKRIRPIADQVLALEKTYADMPEKELKNYPLLFIQVCAFTRRPCGNVPGGSGGKSWKRTKKYLTNFPPGGNIPPVRRRGLKKTASPFSRAEGGSKAPHPL